LRTNDVSPSEYAGLPPACDMTRASSIVSKDFVMKNFLVTKLKKKSMTKGNGKVSIEGNVPLSQATNKKSKSPWNIDNLTMCL
jgi:hypothetical protein